MFTLTPQQMKRFSKVGCEAAERYVAGVVKNAPKWMLVKTLSPSFGLRFSNAASQAWIHRQPLRGAAGTAMSRWSGTLVSKNPMTLSGAANSAGIGVLISTGIGAAESAWRNRAVWNQSKSEFAGRVTYGTTRAAVSSATAAASGAVAGAILGATIGACLAGVGAVPGAIIGAKIGLFFGGLLFRPVGELVADRVLGGPREEAEANWGKAFKQRFGD